MTSATLSPMPTALMPGGLRSAALAGVPMPVLAGDAAQADLQFGGPVLATGRQGRLQWRHDGQWLFGELEVDVDGADGIDSSTGTPALAARVQQAYRDLFTALRETGFVHAQRLWNYLPRINAPLAGLERYRHFNQGRQQAFLDAGQAAFEGAPAACALGTADGPYCLRVLAARSPSLPLENPRQVSAYHYPQAYGPRSPTFSRAALVPLAADRTALLISGTASIVGHASQHIGDVVAQTDETLNNLQALCEVAQQRNGHAFALHDLVCTVYLRDAAQLATVREALARRLGPQAPLLQHALYLQADICRHDLLVEIEAHATCPHGSATA